MKERETKEAKESDIEIVTREKFVKGKWITVSVRQEKDK
jgi:hypothetical protein